MNYIEARNELMDIYNMLKENSIYIYSNLRQRGVTWHFSPARSPHFGGLWESYIKILKQHLLKTIGTTNLLYDEFTTILIRTEVCLTLTSDDPNNSSVLTPANFLVGGYLSAVPESELIQEKQHLLSPWEKTQQIVNHFWQR